ncbi:MAG: hypothetical protein GXO85_12570 [Chlorobi bacterium]|nr:hypothetical protein [Chlorobiota bacterium]
MKRTHLFLMLFASLFLSSVVTIIVALVNDKLFLERHFLKELLTISDRAMFPARPVSLPGLEWPLHSLLFVVLTLSAYWYAFGRCFQKRIKTKAWRYSLAIPVVTGIIWGDIFLVVYVICSYLGGSAAEKGAA